MPNLEAMQEMVHCNLQKDRVTQWISLCYPVVLPLDVVAVGELEFFWFVHRPSLAEALHT